ncbi:4Fe-4S dicluster domain-containing protein [Dehalogenimonas sp. THU2]|uniref:4Fe-4S dicluster domain-containing protein n=1 Tax=Dehalogenimonas sp. THU2 TaxID=3151121 RepID=UPI003218A04F
MPIGILVDTTKCTGCRGCQVACKQWNLLPGVQTKYSPTLTNPIETNAYTFNHVEFFEIEEAGKLHFVSVHKRCFHCSSPACVSVCPVGALQKLENGAVVWEEGRCIGCRYCQNACPFDIPKFTWYDQEGKSDPWPKIQKCTFCWDRVKDGMIPACAKTCPPDAIEFGERADLIALAHSRISANPTRYNSHIYGEFEAGGTSVVYINAVEPEKLGFPEVEEEFYPEFTHEFLSKIPFEVATLAAVLGGIYAFRVSRTAKNGTAAKH